MNEHLEEQACLYVLDRLADGERATFEVQLLQDPEVAAFVRALETAVAQSIRALPQSEPPADTLARVEARLEDPRRGSAKRASRSRPTSLGWTGIARWGIAAVIALSLATLAVHTLLRASRPPVMVFVGLDAARSTSVELPLRAGGRDRDARFIRLASLAGDFWSHQAELPVKPGAAPDANRAYALFDPGSRQGFIAVEHLPVAGADQRYHLWLIDSTRGRAYDAGILPLGDMHRGLYSFAVGSTRAGSLSHPDFVITLESAGRPSGVELPQGKVMLGREDF